MYLYDATNEIDDKKKTKTKKKNNKVFLKKKEERIEERRMREINKKTLLAACGFTSKENDIDNDDASQRKPIYSSLSISSCLRTMERNEILVRRHRRELDLSFYIIVPSAHSLTWRLVRSSTRCSNRRDQLSPRARHGSIMDA